MSQGESLIGQLGSLAQQAGLPEVAASQLSGLAKLGLGMTSMVAQTLGSTNAAEDIDALAGAGAAAAAACVQGRAAAGATKRALESGWPPTACLILSRPSPPAIFCRRDRHFLRPAAEHDGVGAASSRRQQRQCSGRQQQRGRRRQWRGARQRQL